VAKKRKKWLIAVLILFTGLVMWQIWRGFVFKAEKKKEKAKEKQIIANMATNPVRINKTERVTLDEVLYLTGDVRGRAEVDVYPKVPGKLIKKVKAEEAYVNKNDIVLLVDRDETAMDYANAEVKSPISGIITRYYTDIGGSVSPQLPIFNVADMNEVKVIVNVIEKDITRIRHNQQAAVYVDAYPNRKFMGTVDTINQALDRVTRTIEVRVAVDNPLHMLKPGMFARVELLIGSKVGVVAVPVESVLGGENNRYVFIVENNRAIRKTIITGISNENLIEVAKGLNEGDKIVTAGQGKLKDNAEVRVVE